MAAAQVLGASRTPGGWNRAVRSRRRPGLSGEGKTDMDGASEMNRPSEEPAVTPTGCVMSRLSAQRTVTGPSCGAGSARVRTPQPCLRGARACLALLAAAVLLALAAPAQAQTEIWSAHPHPRRDRRRARLRQRDRRDLAVTAAPPPSCRTDDFTHDSTDYSVIRTSSYPAAASRSLSTPPSPPPPTASPSSSAAPPGAFAAADITTAHVRIWNQHRHRSLTAGTAIDVKLTAAGTTNSAPTVATEIPNQTAMSEALRSATSFRPPRSRMRTATRLSATRRRLADPRRCPRG